MGVWLLRSDPETYSFEDLQREKKTVWDGVRNHQALQYLRRMEVRDEIFVYHSGMEKCVVGLAEVACGPYLDPKEDDSKWVVVDLKVGRQLPTRIPLARIKADSRFESFGLVRHSRLSVMPVSELHRHALRAMGGL